MQIQCGSSRAIVARVLRLARDVARLGVLLPAVLLAACSTSGMTGAAAQAGRQPLEIAEQGSFFIGGRDLHSDTLSPLPSFAATGTIAVDQMYVRYQIPVQRSHVPIVLIHGCCLTGKSWETTPDGRMGWDEFFLRKGYPTYVVDQASRGRSAADPTTTVGARQGKLPPGQLPAVFSAGREGAWKIFRFGPEYPKIYAGLQYPLQAQDQLWKQMVPDWSAAQAVPNPTVPDLSLLVKRLGGAILVSHSQSGIYPFQVASIDPSGIAAIVALEPGSCPKPDEDVRPYTHIPTLLVYGDFIAQSTDWWVPRLKACEAFVEAINAAGGKARIVHLPDVGFHGNTHMMMQDLNSLDVAEWLSRWLDGHGGQQRG